jgi:hypothetical protein
MHGIGKRHDRFLSGTENAAIVLSAPIHANAELAHPAFGPAEGC